MATLAAMLKRIGLDVQGSDQDVYPPMSDFLAAERIRTLVGYHADHITGDLDLIVVTTSSTAVSEERRDHRRQLFDIVEQQILPRVAGVK